MRDYKKMRVDFSGEPSLPFAMDDIDRELTLLLCTKIGMPMEDHSTLALTVGGKSDDKQKVAVDDPTEASTKIVKLAAAAQFIAEYPQCTPV